MILFYMENCLNSIQAVLLSIYPNMIVKVVFILSVFKNKLYGTHVISRKNKLLNMWASLSFVS